MNPDCSPSAYTPGLFSAYLDNSRELERFLITPEWSAFFLAETTYDSARCTVKFAGLDVKDNASGDYQGATPVTHRGRPELRYIAVQIVFALKAHDPVFRRRYQMLRQRRQHPLKNQQALVALACKYLRMVWTMCVQRTTYNQTVAEHGTDDRVINTHSA